MVLENFSKNSQENNEIFITVVLQIKRYLQIGIFMNHNDDSFGQLIFCGLNSIENNLICNWLQCAILWLWYRTVIPKCPKTSLRWMKKNLILGWNLSFRQNQGSAYLDRTQTKQILKISNPFGPIGHRTWTRLDQLSLSQTQSRFSYPTQKWPKFQNKPFWIASVTIWWAIWSVISFKSGESSFLPDPVIDLVLPVVLPAILPVGILPLYAESNDCVDSFAAIDLASNITLSVIVAANNLIASSNDFWALFKLLRGIQGPFRIAGLESMTILWPVSTMVRGSLTFHSASPAR